jgi:GNAT superfamily N-acetyltransferase
MSNLLESRSTGITIDRVAPTYGLPRAEQPLSTLAKTPEILIPWRLRQYVDRQRTAATAYTYSVGHFFDDNGYDANLAVLVSEVLDRSYQPDPETTEIFWNKVMEDHRKRALSQEKIDEKHRPLMSVVAHSPDQMGVDMMYFVLAPELRGEGLGTDFYEEFENELRRRGYHYISGDNRMTTQPRFYREGQGRQPVNTLDPYIVRRLGLDPKPSRTIKFLDDGSFEALVLAPKPASYGQR